MGAGVGVVELIGRLLFGAYFVYTGTGFHIPKSAMAEGYFGRNVIIVGACLVMFAFFAAAGDALRYTIIGPAITS